MASLRAYFGLALTTLTLAVGVRMGSAEAGAAGTRASRWERHTGRSRCLHRRARIPYAIPRVASASSACAPRTACGETNLRENTCPSVPLARECTGPRRPRPARRWTAGTDAGADDAAPPDPAALEIRLASYNVRTSNLNNSAWATPTSAGTARRRSHASHRRHDRLAESDSRRNAGARNRSGMRCSPASGTTTSRIGIHHPEAGAPTTPSCCSASRFGAGSRGPLPDSAASQARRPQSGRVLLEHQGDGPRCLGVAASLRRGRHRCCRRSARGGREADRAIDQERGRRQKQPFILAGDSTRPRRGCGRRAPEVRDHEVHPQRGRGLVNNGCKSSTAAREPRASKRVMAA